MVHQLLACHKIDCSKVRFKMKRCNVEPQSVHCQVGYDVDTVTHVCKSVINWLGFVWIELNHGSFSCILQLQIEC